MLKTSCAKVAAINFDKNASFPLRKIKKKLKSNGELLITATKAKRFFVKNAHTHIENAVVTLKKGVKNNGTL
jgi:hypothetical protein